MNQHQCNREFDFTLLVEGVKELNQTVEDALFVAGCDDATISMRFGRLVLTFSRSASSMKDAILSAIVDVRNADIGGVLRVDECDLVTQSEIARRIDRTRQMVHQYITGKRGPGSFPSPVCNLTDNVPLWYWCEVAYWLWNNNLIKENALHDAREKAIINNILELQYYRALEPGLADEVFNSLCGCE